MSEELKRCPFCGQSKMERATLAAIEGDPRPHQIVCRRCGARGPTAWDEEEAVKWWNRAPRADLKIVRCPDCQTEGVLRADGAVVIKDEYMYLKRCEVCQKQKEGKPV